jgi:hypothetical protein
MGTARIQVPATRCRRWYAAAAEPDATPGRPPARVAARRERGQPSGSPGPPSHPAALGTACSRTRGMPGQKMKTEVSCRAYGSGRASRRSRNTMRVKPYPIRSPSLNARHTALPAPGGSMSTSGCSCRYRSSLRTWSGGPGGTSCTGQYRYPVSGQRNGFPRSPATRHRRRSHERIPPSWTLPVPMTTLYHRRICSGRQAAPIHHRTADYRRAPVRLSGAQIGGRPAHPHADERASGTTAESLAAVVLSLNPPAN